MLLEGRGLDLLWSGVGQAVLSPRSGQKSMLMSRLEAALSWLPWAPAHLAGAKLAFSPLWLRCICWVSVVSLV